MQAIWNELVAKTRDFVHEAGFEKAVIGLSGGIDSAVVACIACAALGKENVLGVLMPSPYSSDGSRVDARSLAANWGFAVVKLQIHALMALFDSVLDSVVDRDDRRVVTGENLQARIRAVLLMALSNEHDRLVLNTCNKSEDWTGYCTLYGDSCGAVAPIGGLYKTEVYALARWVNSAASPALPVIPVAILDKAPSAELSAGQKDEDELPPYAVLDPILRIFVDEKGTIQDAVAAGFDAPTCARVWELMHGSAFKRKQSAPIIELTGGLV